MLNESTPSTSTAFAYKQQRRKTIICGNRVIEVKQEKSPRYFAQSKTSDIESAVPSQPSSRLEGSPTAASLSETPVFSAEAPRKEKRKRIIKETGEAHPLRVAKKERVLWLTGLSATTLYNKTNPKSRYFDSSFPQKISLSDHEGGCKGWIESEVLAWIKNRANSRFSLSAGLGPSVESISRGVQ